MRLAEVLSKPPSLDFEQIEGFLGDKTLKIGIQRKIDIGEIALNYFCKSCNDVRTFHSGNNLYCIGVNEHMVSIDCVLKCHCSPEALVQVWFLIDCNGDIWGHAPEVRILLCREKLSGVVQTSKYGYGNLSKLLEKAEQAHRDGLGAGSIVYLRKIFEQITSETAAVAGISDRDGDKRKSFKKLLQEVDEQCSIIPKEFSNNRYRLFGELSAIVHGNFDEELALQKYDSLHRLLIGILDNIKNNGELTRAMNILGWSR